MTPTESAALRDLADRSFWWLDEVPPTATLGIIRRLDQLGFIEFQPWHVHGENGPQPIGGWTSPMRKPADAGTWEAIWDRYRTRGQWEHPGQLRLNDAGRAEVDRMNEQPGHAANTADSQVVITRAVAASGAGEPVPLRRDVDRLVRQRLDDVGLADAAARLAFAVSDDAWWAKQVDAYRARARRYGAMEWTISQKRAEHRRFRPDRRVVRDPATATVRPFWRFAVHVGVPAIGLDEEPPPPRNIAQAWDLVLHYWLMTTEDAPLEGLGLGAIAAWHLGEGWGRRTFLKDVVEGLAERGSTESAARALIEQRLSEALTMIRDRLPPTAPPAMAEVKLPPAGLPVPATSDQSAAVNQTTPQPVLPPIRPYDREAWCLWKIGGKDQTEIAAMLNKKHGLTLVQGGVSRMCNRFQKYVDAGGVAKDLPQPADRERTVDPARTELGARRDKRRPRPSDTGGSDGD